jgi:hypothetical protein
VAKLCSDFVLLIDFFGVCCLVLLVTLAIRRFRASVNAPWCDQCALGNAHPDVRPHSCALRYTRGVGVLLPSEVR